MSFLKYIVIAYIGFFIYKQSSSLTYYVDEVDEELVQASLTHWLGDSISISRNRDERTADLIVEIVEEAHMHEKKLLGEQKENRVCLNRSKIQKLNKRELENLISHEIGHYFFKFHNKDISIMNHLMPLSMRCVTKQDTDYYNFKLAVLMQKFNRHARNIIAIFV